MSKREALMRVSQAYNYIGDNNAYDADPRKPRMKLHLESCGSPMRMPKNYCDVRYVILFKTVIALFMIYLLLSCIT